MFHPDALRRRLAALLAGAGAAACWALLPPAAHAQGASAVTAPAAAQASNARPAWADLSPVNQRILAPLQPLWDSLPELNRHKWLRIAERYPKFSPAEQARLQARMTEWVKMTPQQRRLARENYQITRALPAEKKAEAWDKYQQLPEEQKRSWPQPTASRIAPALSARCPAASACPATPAASSTVSRKRPAPQRAAVATLLASPPAKPRRQPASAPAAVSAASAPAARHLQRSPRRIRSRGCHRSGSRGF